MSKYHIETTKRTTINGVKYKAEINKDVSIYFASTGYTVRYVNEQGESVNEKIELIPDDISILCEVTDLFPLLEYDIRITQSLYRHIKPHVSLYLDIRNKTTGEKVFLIETAQLSDIDYDYVRDILAKEIPEYDWQTAENYLRANIEQYLGENRLDDLFTDDAFHFLSRMASARWEEIKTKDYVGFEDGAMASISKAILEEALRSAYEQQS